MDSEIYEQWFQIPCVNCEEYLPHPVSGNVRWLVGKDEPVEKELVCPSCRANNYLSNIIVVSMKRGYILKNKGEDSDS